MEKIKEYYLMKILGTKKDLMIRFLIMAASDMVLLYAFCFIQEMIYDVGIKAMYSTVSAYIMILLWVIYVFSFMIIMFRDYIDFSAIDKMFKK